MFTKFTLTTVMMIFVISLAGCKTNNPTDPTPGEASEKSQNTASDATDSDSYQMLPFISGTVANLKLDVTADGSTQKINKGEVISITLESNASTGYSWIANISDSAILMQMGEAEYAQPTQSDTPIVGSPGKQTFYFQAVESGTVTLTLDYKRAWESDVQPVQTITIIVEVQ